MAFSELGVAGGLLFGVAVSQLSHWLHHGVGGGVLATCRTVPSLQGVGGAGADGDSWVRFWGRVPERPRGPWTHLWCL